jgi:hypothetical protein
MESDSFGDEVRAGGAGYAIADAGIGIDGEWWELRNTRTRTRPPPPCPPGLDPMPGLQALGTIHLLQLVTSQAAAMVMAMATNLRVLRV